MGYTYSTFAGVYSALDLRIYRVDAHLWVFESVNSHIRALDIQFILPVSESPCRFGLALRTDLWAVGVCNIYIYILYIDIDCGISGMFIDQMM